LPHGIIVIGWDTQKGAIVEAKYPDYLPVQENDLIALYSAHKTSNLKPSNLYLKIRGKSFISYYLGVDLNKCVAAMLQGDENPVFYTPHFIKLVKKFFTSNSVDYKKILPQIYSKLEKLKSAEKMVRKVLKMF